MSDAIRRSVYITPIDDDRIVKVSGMLKALGLNGFHKRDGTINRSAMFMYALEELENELKGRVTDHDLKVIYGKEPKRTKKGAIGLKKPKSEEKGQLN